METRGDYCEGAQVPEVAEEEVDGMTEAEEEDEVGEEGMVEMAEMVGSVERMKAMEGATRSSPTFFVLQTATEVSGVCFLTFRFGISSGRTR
jgi:hypothetical protein